MPMQTVIRRAEKGEADVLALLNGDVQAIHASAVPWLFKAPGPETFPEREFAFLLEVEDNLLFIAEVDGAPAGYAFAEIMRRPESAFCNAYDLVHLHHISVRPAHRRHGVGTALLAAVRAAADERNIKLIEIGVWNFNEAARDFFRRHGFAARTETLWNR
jgi:ribosomal protein S18 acetylase RimI-like enzyme